MVATKPSEAEVQVSSFILFTGVQYVKECIMKAAEILCPGNV